MKLKYYFSAFFSFLLLFFCSKSDQNYTIEIKDGVNYVHNHAQMWGEEPKVALEFVRKIGEEESQDENYNLFMPLNIAEDNLGNLYVADARNYRIQKFDLAGKYLKTFGRKGYGPGEFSHIPAGINLDPKGNLYVANGLNIQIFSPDGKEINRIKFSFEVGDFLIFNSDQFLFPYKCLTVFYGDEEKTFTQNSSLFGLFDYNASLLKKFGKIKEFRDNNITRMANMNFITIDSNNYIYNTFLYQNRIEKYSPEGKLLWRADRPLNYELFYKVEEDVYESKEGELSVSFSPRLFNQVSTDLCVDYKGRLWITTYKKQYEKNDKFNDLYEFEIFNNEGILLGRVPIPEQTEKIKIIQDRLFLLGVESIYIYEYKILEKY